MSQFQMPQMPFVDVNKMMEQFQQFKLPGLDVAALLDARRKDIEAIAEANKQTYDGMQSLAQRQGEIMQDAMTQWQAMAANMATQNPTQAQAQQAELARRTMENALTNMRELAEMAANSQRKTFEVVSKRANENIEDMKKMMQGNS